MNPQNNPAQQSQRIPSKLLRYKFEVREKEVKMKKLIGIRCHFSTSGPKNLCKSLKDFKKANAIRNLHYECPARPKFLSDPLPKNIIKRLGVFSKLQKLRISYGHSSKIYQHAFESLLRGINRMTNLKDFQLIAPFHPRGDDYQFEILGKTLRRVAKLERIVLNFDLNDYITANRLGDLTQRLQRLAYLKTLSLSFKHIERIEDGAMSRFSQNLKKYSALENFSLVFLRNLDICDLDLQNLNDGLKNLPNLKSIKLGLRACDRISDIGVEKLFEGLDKLERIWVNFRGCDRITDASPQSLGERLTALQTLKKLTIKFRGCGKITDEGVGGLMEGIRVMCAIGGCLEEMTLIFSGCGKLTFEGLWHIWEALQEISSLKNVQLGLKNCKNLPEEKISHMIEDLKKRNPEMKLTVIADNLQVWQGERL